MGYTLVSCQDVQIYKMYPLHDTLICRLLHLIKQNCKKLCRNSNLDDLGISLPVFPLKTNLKLHNFSVTSKLITNVTTKFITDLDLSKASSPDCIPVVVLKNCESKLSYILAELFNMCLKESCFPGCWRSHWWSQVFKNVGKICTTKSYRPASLLSMFSKVFEKLVNNRLVDHIGKCGLLPDFQFGFRSS